MPIHSRRVDYDEAINSENCALARELVADPKWRWWDDAYLPCLVLDSERKMAVVSLSNLEDVRDLQNAGREVLPDLSSPHLLGHLISVYSPETLQKSVPVMVLGDWLDLRSSAELA